MKKILSIVPNTITSLNLFSGCVACVMAFNGNFFWAAMFIYLGSVFDFFDGMSARALDVHSPIGKDLDSLADMVTFGVAPGVVTYKWLCELLPGNEILPFVAFLIPVFSALRLAKFNIDTRQTTSFIGLPTPANSIFFASLIAVASLQVTSNSLLANFAEVMKSLCAKEVVIIALVLLFSWLLVAEIPMFSLKFKNLKWADNKIRFIFLMLSVLMLLVLWWGAAPLIILLFIAMSIANRKG